MHDKLVVITDYLKYRAELRGFDIKLIEDIVRYSQLQYGIVGLEGIGT